MGKKKPLFAVQETASHSERPTYGYITPWPRPQTMKGKTQKYSTGCCSLYVTINETEDGQPFELFSKMGKSGGCSASQCEALGRSISLSLRCNIDPAAIIKQLSGISCHQPTWENGKTILSCSDAIAKALKRYSSDKEPYYVHENNLKDEKMTAVSMKVITSGTYGVCPQCSGTLEHSEGCLLCRECGYSKCG